MVGLNEISRTTVYRADDHYCNQAIVIRLQNDDVLAIFNEERGYAHMDNGYTTIIRSTDGGKTWDPSSRSVVLPANEVEGNWDPAIAQLADGTLMVNLCQTAYFKRGMNWEAPQYDANEFWSIKGWLGTFVMRSSDNGRSWGRPIPVNTRPIKHGGTRVGVLELPDGGILLPMYGRAEEYGYFGSGETTRAYMVRSDDGGANWEYYSTVAYDAAHINAFSEPAPLRLPDGRIVCIMRSHILPTKRPDNMYMAVSEDDGHTFGLPKRLGVWGYPAQLINLQDGRVLMTFGYRRNEFGVKALISEDGVTWDVSRQFSLHEGSTGPKSDRNWWHTGYPCSAQLADGSIVTVYHLFSQDERPVQYVESVRWRLPD
jgi:sialidase-1